MQNVAYETERYNLDQGLAGNQSGARRHCKCREAHYRATRAHPGRGSAGSPGEGGQAASEEVNAVLAYIADVNLERRDLARAQKIMALAMQYPDPEKAGADRG